MDRKSTAKIHTIEAIRRYIYSQFNFPLEAAASVIFLHTAMELLLREEYEAGGGDAYSVGEWSQRRRIYVGDLIKNRSRWATDRAEREMALWLNTNRNVVLHAGRFPLDDQSVALSKLEGGFHLVGRLWMKDGLRPESHFSSFESQVLRGSEPGWQEKSDALSLAATQYCAIESQCAVNIANAAFEYAVRGLAKAWRVHNADTSALEDLIQVMENIDDDRAHPSLFNDWVRVEYTHQVFGGDRIEWFIPPMSLTDVVNASDGSWDELRAAMNYTSLIRDVVLSYPERVP